MHTLKPVTTLEHVLHTIVHPTFSLFHYAVEPGGGSPSAKEAHKKSTITVQPKTIAEMKAEADAARKAEELVTAAEGDLKNAVDQSLSDLANTIKDLDQDNATYNTIIEHFSALVTNLQLTESVDSKEATAEVMRLLAGFIKEQGFSSFLRVVAAYSKYKDEQASHFGEPSMHGMLESFSTQFGEYIVKEYAKPDSQKPSENIQTFVTEILTGDTQKITVDLLGLFVDLVKDKLSQDSAIIGILEGFSDLASAFVKNHLIRLGFTKDDAALIADGLEDGAEYLVEQGYYGTLGGSSLALAGIIANHFGTVIDQTTALDIALGLFGFGLFVDFVRFYIIPAITGNKVTPVTTEKKNQ